MFFVTQQPNLGPGFLNVKVSRSHTIRYTHTLTHSVRLLRTSDQVDAEAATYTRDEHPCHQQDSSTRFQQKSEGRTAP